jgi:hypothetical protein
MSRRPTAKSRKPNPFSGALVAIYVTGYVIGFILVGVGASNAASYSPSDFGGTDNGIAFIVWGGAFLNLAIVATVVHLGVAAILHRFRPVAEPVGEEQAPPEVTEQESLE